MTSCDDTSPVVCAVGFTFRVWYPETGQDPESISVQFSGIMKAPSLASLRVQFNQILPMMLAVAPSEIELRIGELV